jgi:hypothetical protein
MGSVKTLGVGFLNHYITSNPVGPMNMTNIPTARYATMFGVTECQLPDILPLASTNFDDSNQWVSL